MEYYTAPHDDNHVYDIEPKIRRNIDVSTKPTREMNSKMSGTINNNEKDEDRKRKRKNKKTSVKSQQQHPNAGPDDLKFFQ
jgi:DNA-binding transcriptional regulator GbsR (MarR family)